MSDTITPDELEKMLKGNEPPKIVDVRRMTDRASDPSGIPGAEWKDPEKVAEWGKDLGKSNIVVYCVRGGSVSRSVQEKLREQKIDVKFIEGGLEAWKKAGKTVQRS